ncbi:uncharacterized protein AKAW2_20965A [Aspergillus luchuensis]|uniref:C3H1-type domain-containing protein n=1 Tax=Aspergillus kawachii TaxID=1069201 RepID=A0A7R7W475_ASPKA|nr:uncharacterized protein AKAW2_20965A [Aspergillus luchuensis]BCR96025.1 hypothetical protein AKAW2_20965A [Aspergillus luchuensis]
MSSTIHPQYFCTRPNGTFTPLIAVDELPSHISIRGAPRVLAASETQGMTSLGIVQMRPQSYVVEGVGPAPTRETSTSSTGHRTRDSDLQAALMRVLSDECLPTNERRAITTLIQHGLSRGMFTPSSTSNGWLVPNSGGSIAGNVGSRQGPHYNTKKEYCSYWIRHGECDYSQQGCLFKHEMPGDPAMLEKLGLRDIPRWYREKYGIPSLIPNGHVHPRHQIGHALPLTDNGGFGAVHNPSRLGANIISDISDFERDSQQKTHYAIQHSPAALPGSSRPVYAAAGPSRAQMPQRHGAKNSSKVDLLSFDPLPEYPSYTSVESAPGKMRAPANANGTAAFASVNSEREDFVRSIQSLMPTPMSGISEYLPAGGSPYKPRSKKAQKSRRLYQPRPPVLKQESEPEASEVDAFSGDCRGYGTAPPSVASPISKVDHPSPNIRSALDSASEPATRGASPLNQSGTASSDSSPDLVRDRQKDKKEHKATFGAIGTKRGYGKSCDGSFEVDLLGLGTKDDE